MSFRSSRRTLVLPLELLRRVCPVVWFRRWPATCFTKSRKKTLRRQMLTRFTVSPRTMAMRSIYGYMSEVTFSHISGMFTDSRHRSVQPNDFSYKHEAKHCHMVVTAQLWNGKTDDDVLEDIRTRLSNCKACEYSLPRSVQRSST